MAKLQDVTNAVTSPNDTDIAYIVQDPSGTPADGKIAMSDLKTYMQSGLLSSETDPVVGAITGIVKADGAGTISAATAGTDYVAIPTVVSLTAQTADVTATAFTGSDTAGIYRVSYYLVTTVLDAEAGTATLTLSFNDVSGAATQVSGTIDLTTLGSKQTGVFICQVADTSSVSYAIAATSYDDTPAAWDCYMTCEKLN